MSMFGIAIGTSQRRQCQKIRKYSRWKEDRRQNNSGSRRCMHGRKAASASPKPATRATEPLELIHSDLCGPIDPTSFGGAINFLLFTDDYTRFTHIYPLKRKTS